MIAIMSASLIERLVDLGVRERSFAAGASLFKRGDRVQSLHFVRGGEVHLVRYQVNGAQLVLQRAGPSSIVAEASIFSERYHCDAVAICATSTRAIDKGALRAALLNSPDLAELWLSYLAGEVQAMRLRAEVLSLRRVSDRLDAFIASQDERAPRRGEWTTVAAEIGVSPEALYRELARRRG